MAIKLLRVGTLPNMHSQVLLAKAADTITLSRIELIRSGGRLCTHTFRIPNAEEWNLVRATDAVSVRQ